MLAEVADRWTPTNASNTVPAYDGYINNDLYSRFIEDGSFLRLKNLTLGYSFPHKLTKKPHFQTACICNRPEPVLHLRLQRL